MAQLQDKRGAFNINPQQHAHQLSQQQHRANFLNSISPSMMGGHEMRHSPPGMVLGSSSLPNQGGMSDGGVVSERLLHRKQAELNGIIEQQRKLYSNLDNLDRQRSQILGDIDKTAAYQKISNDINFHMQGQTGAAAAAARYGNSSHSQLRGQLPPNHMPSHFSPPSHLRPTHQMRPNSSNIGSARDTLHGYSPSTMQFLSNRNGMLPGRDHPIGKPEGQPSSLMEPDFGGGGFGNVPSGFPPKTSAGTALGSLRGRYEDKLREMEGNMNNPNLNDPSHIDKRRRFLSAASSGLLPHNDASKHMMNEKEQLNRLFDNRKTSSFLPSELTMPKNSSAGNSLSVLSSSHQLLMSQREANMNREAQNMLFYQGMNNGRNPAAAGGMNNHRNQQVQRMHDGKLPETKRKLSKDFSPECDTVVLGKGNIPKTNIGNLKLKGIVMDNLVEYANGERRKKIAVISRIINHVTAANYKTTGFVKFEDDVWWEMTERDARVKITALFRDCLHDQYRSSSSSKVKRRQELRKVRSLGSTSTSATPATGTEGETAAAAAEASTEDSTPASTDETKDDDDCPSNGKEADAEASPGTGGAYSEADASTSEVRRDQLKRKSTEE